MRVTNNYTSHLGLGEMRILPGETIALPKGYGENHPVIKFYISRGWLKVVGKGIGKGKTENAVNVNTAINTGSTNDSGGQKMHLDPGQFDGWETEQIFNLAADMGIELGDTPERGDVIVKIAAEEIEVGEYSNLNPEDYGPDGDTQNENINKPAPSPLASKNVNKLTFDELKVLAGEMKLEVTEADTRPTLIEKIKAARKTE